MRRARGRRRRPSGTLGYRMSGPFAFSAAAYPERIKAAVVIRVRVDKPSSHLRAGEVQESCILPVRNWTIGHRQK